MRHDLTFFLMGNCKLNTILKKLYENGHQVHLSTQHNRTHHNTTEHSTTQHNTTQYQQYY